MRKLFAVLACAAALGADVKLPALIGDHMVLQRGVPARVFGWAAPGEQVTVRFQGQTVTATTPSNGKWNAWLKPMPASATGSEMTIAGKNTITVSDVLVGEIWVGSGQSNMGWTVRASNHADREASAANHPAIRLFQVALVSKDEPQEDVQGKWMVCTPQNIPNFSAVLYFFGRDLHKKLNVPMGLIQSAWGGTPAQAWTSRGALYGDSSLFPILGEWNKVLENYPAASERYAKQLADYQAARKAGNAPQRGPAPPMGPGHSHTPAGLYNAMIHPLTPFTIKGAIWYQGESNASKVQAPLYRRLFETMILDWRRAWGQGDFPFLFVQLANFAKAGSPSDWVLVQEAQTLTANELRRTGMAVINDIGEAGDIHPKNKQDVGARLALAARHIAYQEQLVYSGPKFRQATAEGKQMRVWFDSVGGGLQARGGGEIKGFEVAGADGQWQAAEAKADGGTVLAWSQSVLEPVKVRYAWASDPVANLINAEGLPASVFRSE